MDKKLVGMFALFVVVFVFFMVFVIAQSSFRTLIRANEEKLPSDSTSIILGWPLVVPKNSSSTITTFVRSASGRPVPNHEVHFQTSIGHLRDAVVTSDDQGKAETTLLCDADGIAQIKATIDSNIIISQTISIQCGGQ